LYDKCVSSFVVAVILSLLLFGLVVWTENVPPEVPLASEPAERFSARLAALQLGRVLGDEAPHPAGSEANRQVRRNLQKELQLPGIEQALQATSACSPRYGKCGDVENVLARVPGQVAGPVVLLMAHYDSVAAGPGAGDDGAGVVALLDIARIVSELRLRNTVVFAFTDAEEVGLLGAEALFGQPHGWLENIGVVLNVEGLGSAGASRVMRLGPSSGWVLSQFLETAEAPVASPISHVLFPHADIESDFSVSSRYGLPGLELAFVGERQNHHSQNDTIENLSLASLQHQGEGLLSLTRRLASMPLENQGPPELAFMTLFRHISSSWATRWSLPLTGISFLLLGSASALLIRRKMAGTRDLILGAATAFISLLIVGLVAFVVGYASHAGVSGHRQVTLLVPALAIAAAVIAATRALGAFIRQAVPPLVVLLGSCWCWFLGALVTSLLVPSASSLAVPPSLLLACYFYLAVLLPKVRDDIWAVASVLTVTPFSLGTASTVIAICGYQSLAQWSLSSAAVYIGVAMYAVALVPLAGRGGSRRTSQTESVALAAV